MVFRSRNNSLFILHKSSCFWLWAHNFKKPHCSFWNTDSNEIIPDQNLIEIIREQNLIEIIHDPNLIEIIRDRSGPWLSRRSFWSAPFDSMPWPISYGYWKHRASARQYCFSRKAGDSLLEAPLPCIIASKIHQKLLTKMFLCDTTEFHEKKTRRLSHKLCK